MKKVLLIVLIAVVLIIGFIVVQRKNKTEEISSSAKHSAYFIQPYFYTGIEKPNEVAPMEGLVLGGICSHHFYAEREIAKLFSSWRNQASKTVVIIGANHFNVGSADILVSKLSYETPWGLLENDKEKVDLLVSSGLAKDEEDPFVLEHSISVLVGFVKFYLPQARVVPIIIKRGSTKFEIEALAKILSSFDDTLVIASVDFSHHVDMATAERQDQETFKLLQNNDFEALWTLPPEQLDNPPALVAMLKYMDLKNAGEPTIWNTNQARLSGNSESTDVTSYFFASYLAY